MRRCYEISYMSINNNTMMEADGQEVSARVGEFVEIQVATVNCFERVVECRCRWKEIQPHLFVVEILACPSHSTE
jgi:hypothetical protein